jgi:hypothetical protein
MRRHPSFYYFVKFTLLIAVCAVQLEEIITDNSLGIVAFANFMTELLNWNSEVVAGV